MKRPKKLALALLLLALACIIFALARIICLKIEAERINDLFRLVSLPEITYVQKVSRSDIKRFLTKEYGVRPTGNLVEIRDNTQCFGFVYTLDSGQELFGTLVAPKDYKTANYPVIIVPCGYACLNKEDLSSPRHLYMLLSIASQGFVVLASEGGQRYESYVEAEADEYMAYVKDTRTLIDVAERLVFASEKIYLFSYFTPASSTYLALRHDNRIDAAVIIDGALDIDEGTIGFIVDAPEEKKQEIIEFFSMTFWYEEITVPVLIFETAFTRSPAGKQEAIAEILDSANNFDHYEYTLTTVAEGSSYIPEITFEWLLAQ